MRKGTPRPARPQPVSQADRRKVEVYMAPSLYERIERQARRLGLSMSGFVRLRMTEAVERGEQ